MSENVSTWSRLEGLFAAALQLPAEERRDFVARECAGQVELREELQRLLEAEAEVGDFLAPPTLNFVGQRFGAYEALGELGRGGMSVVYKGRRWDGDFEKAVAIKILLLQPRQTLQTSETQILAGLEHPNIARLLDAGATAGGFRFLVMEFVEGVNCSQYAAGLAVAERLRLFVAICRAVQFAHQSLVVHRDLKPANILVTADGTPKLLDFGIAKLLTTDTQVTQTQGIRAYTPDYASPEQILGQAVTTASDVYSLGALLCELLSGKPPRQLNTLSAAELIAAVQRDAIPSLPFGGDLALIVQKALRRVPGERYQSASDLANDVERYLQREPIVARAPSWNYLAGKFVERNRLAVAATSLAVLALVATTGVAVWQAQRALAEKARAEEVKEFITQIFKGANQYTSGARDVAATKLLAQADERIDQTLGARPDLRVELRTIIAESLSSMEDYVPALRIASKAVAESAQYLGADHARTLQVEAMHLHLRKQSEANEVMEKEYQKLVPRMRASKDLEPLYLSFVLESASGVAMALGKAAEAEKLGVEALQIADRHLRASDQQVMHLLVYLSFLYQRTRKFPEALAMAERVHRITFEELKQDRKHPNALDVRMSYGMALCDARQWDKGLVMLREAVSDAEQAHGAKSRTVAFFHNHLARYLAQHGDLNGAIENYARAVQEFASDQTAPQPYVLTTVNQAAMLVAARRIEEALALIGVVDQRSTQYKVAVPVPNQAVFALAKAYEGQVPAALATLAQLETKAPARPVLFNHGVVLRLAGDYKGALERQRRALATPAMTERERAAIETEVGLNELALGNVDAAAQSLEKARAYFAEFVPLVIPAHADALVGLAQIALQRGNLAQALPLAQKANAYWQKAGPGTRWAKAAAEAVVGAEGGNKSKPGQSPNRV
jgi:eukaryotic-like serine/threonine-protein kinase